MSLLELAGVLTGLAAVWLTARQVIWCWPVALVNVSLYGIIFYEARLYADMALQGFYFAASLYGWYYWNQKRPGRPVPVKRAGLPLLLLLAALTLLGTFLIGYTLKRNTDASLPYLDSFLTAASLAGQWLMARKLIENWLLWIGVNILYVGMFLYKHLYLTAGLYALFIILAVIGYLEWKKSLQKSR